MRVRATGTLNTYDNYSAAVVQLPVRIDGRVALARRGFLREPEEAALPEVEAGSEELRRKFRVPLRAALGLATELSGAHRFEPACRGSVSP